MVSFNFFFTKFVLGSSGGLKFVILVEDFDTGDPSSIAVRKEYLFAFQFWFWEFSVGNNQWEEDRGHYFVLFLFGCALIIAGWGLVGQAEILIYIFVSGVT